jgi:hypothetical protein
MTAASLRTPHLVSLAVFVLGGALVVGALALSSAVWTLAEAGQTDRFVATDGDDTDNDCTVEAEPCATIEHAIAKADAGDTINVAAGDYTEPGLMVAKDLTIRGAGSESTNVQAHEKAGEAPDQGVMRIDAEVTIERVTVRHGNYIVGVGVGIFVSASGVLTLESSVVRDNFADTGGGIGNLGSVTLNDSTVSDNDAVFTGGGIWNGADATLTLTNSTVSGNETNGNGGGIYNDGGDVTLTGSEVIENVARGDGVGDGGGGIFNDGGTLDLTKSTVSNNETERTGGGIESAGTLTLNNSTIIGNTAGTSGGGIWNEDTMTVENSAIVGNSANFGGSGIRNWGTLTVTNSTIFDNAGRTGGGIDNSGTLTLTNSTISGNSADIAGGGIWNSDTVIVQNSTISGNSAGEGGGIRNSGDVTVKNSIVAESPSGGNCSLPGGTFTGEGDNLDDDGTCTGFEEVPDVMLGPLADNGGPTFTHALLPDSPAIDAVTDCTLEDGVTPVATDQRGVPRPQREACDIGAFELGILRVWGDLDCDGSVVIGDALKTARYLLGLSVSQEPGCPEPGAEPLVNAGPRAWGDVDCDSAVAIGDALKIARWLLGLSVSQEDGCPEIGTTVDVAD